MNERIFLNAVHDIFGAKRGDQEERLKLLADAYLSGETCGLNLTVSRLKAALTAKEKQIKRLEGIIDRLRALRRAK